MKFTYRELDRACACQSGLSRLAEGRYFKTRILNLPFTTLDVVNGKNDNCDKYWFIKYILQWKLLQAESEELMSKTLVFLSERYLNDDYADELTGIQQKLLRTASNMYDAIQHGKYLRSGMRVHDVCHHIYAADSIEDPILDDLLTYWHKVA